MSQTSLQDRAVVESMKPSLNTSSISSMPEPFSNSQESYVSVSSTGTGAPRIQSSSSNLSTSTVDTTQTSPTSSIDPTSQFKIPHKTTPLDATSAPARPITPKLNTSVHHSSSNNGGSPTTSPMAVDTPYLAQGSKRTASGVVKAPVAGMADSPVGGPRGGHSRTTSVDSNVSRIGELSAQLKTRLSYAMVKVQNGWEKYSIDEVEEISSQRNSPNFSTPIAEGSSGRRRRPSAVSDGSDQYMHSPSMLASPLGASRTVNGTSYYTSRAGSDPTSRPTTAQTTTSLAPHGSGLAPAADIVSRRNRRSNSTRAPPMLSNMSRGSAHHNDLTSPKTPTTGAPRAGILRMPSGQAEQDAVDTLLFMSSPNNSSRLAHTSTANSTAQPSPLRTEFPIPKKVVFEDRSTSSSSEPDNERNTKRRSLLGDNSSAQQQFKMQLEQAAGLIKEKSKASKSAMSSGKQR